MSTYTINVSFQTRVNKTTRTLEIAESFGLGLDEKDWTLYDNLELEVEQGDVVFCEICMIFFNPIFNRPKIENGFYF